MPTSLPSSSTTGTAPSPILSDLSSVLPDKPRQSEPSSATTSRAPATADSPIAASSSRSLAAAPAAAAAVVATSSSSSSASTSASTPAASRAGPSAAGSAADEIEMEPITNGHRRRKSSLMSPASSGPQSSLGTGPGRPGANAQGLRIQTPSGLPDDSIIAEEDGRGSYAGSVLSKDERGGGARDSFSDEDLQDDEEMGLTSKDKKRRQKKRTKNTRLDQRIVREKNLSPEESKEADKNVMKRLLMNGFLILLWYLFSLSISLYNKWMFDSDNLNFAFPLFTTAMHMLVQFALATLVLYLVPSLRPYAGHNSDQGRSRHESEPASNNNFMTKMFYLTRISPCGAATGLDIGLGNTSLKFISLTFYTMCKSSSLAFVLIFAFLFRLETPTWRLVAIILTMILGVVLMVFGEVEFSLGGFFLVIAAAFFSGFRWGLTQILLLRNPATSNPFSSIFFLTPIMFVTLFILAIPVEGFRPLFEGLSVLSSSWGPFMTPLLLMFPGCIAFCMTAAEFALLQRTSVVTLSIAGIFKEVVTISAASLVFQDTLTVINFVGLLTTMAAIAAYNYVKISKMRAEARGDIHDRDAAGDDDSPSSNTNSDADNDDAGEDVGLLRQSVENGETLFNADGDFQPDLMPPPGHTRADSKEFRSEHTD